MSEADARDLASLLESLRVQAASGNLRLTQHAQQEMVEENIVLQEVLDAVAMSRVLERYPEHRRGPCCLLNGMTQAGRPLHVVCTTARPTLILITVYEPKPPKWVTPTQRRSEP